MSDTGFTTLDDRGRAAAAEVRSAAELRPLEPVGAPARAPRPWVRPVALLTALAALAAVLLVVVHRRNEVADRDPGDLRYIVGDLPGGWSPVHAKDAGVDEWTSDQKDAVALYGTAGDPSAPTIHLYIPQRDVTVDAFMLFGTDDVRGFEIDGRPSGCGTTTYGAPMTTCVAQLADGGVLVTAAHISFEQLLPLLQTMVIAHGTPYLDPAALPAGMSPLWSGPTEDESAMALGGGSSASVSYVQYSGPNGTRGFLATGWADQQELAGAFNESMHPVQVGAVQGYAGVGSLSGVARVVWTADGRSFALTFDGTEESAIALATSVRPASGIEWANLEAATTGTTQPLNTGPGETTTTPAPTVPVTLDPMVRVVTDVPLKLTIDPSTPDDLRLSAALPDGTFGEIDVVIIGTKLLFRGDNGGGSGVDVSEGDGVDAVPMSRHGGYSVITTDPATYAELRVTRSNGERYVMDMREIPGHPGIYAAVIGVPDDEMVSYEVLDDHGKVTLSGV